MEFKELPEYAQVIALQALKDLIVQGPVHEKSQPKNWLMRFKWHS